MVIPVLVTAHLSWLEVSPSAARCLRSIPLAFRATPHGWRLEPHPQGTTLKIRRNAWGRLRLAVGLPPGIYRAYFHEGVVDLERSALNLSQTPPLSGDGEALHLPRPLPVAPVPCLA